MGPDKWKDSLRQPLSGGDSVRLSDGSVGIMEHWSVGVAMAHNAGSTELRNYLMPVRLADGRGAWLHPTEVTKVSDT